VDAAALRPDRSGELAPSNAKREQIMQDNEYFPPDKATPYPHIGKPRAHQVSGSPYAADSTIASKNAERECITHFSQEEANSYLQTGDHRAKRGGGRTLARWRRQGTGPPYIRLPGKIVYRKADLDEWLKKRRVQPVRERGAQ
jgi:hypothetical protein